MPKTWHVYILRCGDGTLYAGATSDLPKRLDAHRAGTGAKYTRGRTPLTLVWKRRVRSWSAALKLEARIKRMARTEKQALIRNGTLPKKRVSR